MEIQNQASARFPLEQQEVVRVSSAGVVLGEIVVRHDGMRARYDWSTHLREDVLVEVPSQFGSAETLGQAKESIVSALIAYVEREGERARRKARSKAFPSREHSGSFVDDAAANPSEAFEFDRA